MTISIMGCGWLGFPLAQHLIELGYTIKGSTTSESKLEVLQKAGISPFLLKAVPQIEGNLDFFKSDILILNIPPKRRHPQVEIFHPKQIQATIEQIKKGGISKVIFVSSTGVYPNTGNIATEDTPLQPVRSSGVALVQAERLLQAETAFQTTILRMSGLVGKDRKAGRFFAGKSNLPNGKALVNMVHLVDCIGVITAILKQEIWGDIFNVCADEHPTKANFYTAQAKKEGFVKPSFLMNETTDFKVVSNEKIKRILDYTFRYSDPMDF